MYLQKKPYSSFHAKRPKLYSFFNKVNSQNIDFSYTSDNDLVDLAKRFREKN